MPKLEFPFRDPLHHKGQVGKVLIIAGSQKYHGAPIFNALGVESAGADLISLYLPSQHVELAKAKCLNTFINPFVKGDLGLKDIGLILEEAKNYHCVLIGSGIGTEADTKKAVNMILQELTVPVVIDGDALQPDIIVLPKKAPRVITPHAGEFQRIFSIKASEENVKTMAASHDLIILQKSVVDVISSPKDTYLNNTGCNQMRVGGTGDALAGICASFISQGATPFDAASSAAYYFGNAGKSLTETQRYFSTEMLIRHFAKIY
jgi:hydroxyethylthiazole kinase-like uncharacterized protein yjeF